MTATATIETRRHPVVSVIDAGVTDELDYAVARADRLEAELAELRARVEAADTKGEK